MNFISKQPKENMGLSEQYLKVSLGKSFCRQIIQNGLCQNTAFRQKKVNSKNPVKNILDLSPPPNQAAGSAGHLSAPLCVPVSSNSKKMKKSTVTLLRNAPRSPKDHCFLEGSRPSPVCPSGKCNM